VAGGIPEEGREELEQEADLAARDAADKVEVAVEKVVGGEGVGVFPEDLLEGDGLGFAGVGLDSVKEEDERWAAGGVVLVAGDFGTDLGFDAELFGEFAPEGLFGRFAGFDLAAGELPLEAMAVAGHALPDEDFAVALKHTGDYDHCAGHGKWKKMGKEIFPLYSERLLEHFRNPRRGGEAEGWTVEARVDNPACGDRLRLTVRVRDGVVEEAGFEVRGCTASMGCGSAVADWVVGKTAADLRGLTAAAVEELVDGLPEASRHAAALAVDGVRGLAAKVG
jgi:nitrogen fixation NifU-like protein